ncbi:MAG: 1-deoxy-D-xylulose-5-phosphate synthase, partial [Desulfomonile tiedjei]|nr:1-deoxy-D-xylulose-5-phosphate synthase [Desulfomonile tiedjei]
AKNPKVVAVTAAMEYGTGLAEFARLFPKRFFDVGIAEQHGVVFAAGLAKEGYRPVVAIYSTFMQRGYDHLIHDVCMQKFPVVFAMDRAGLVGEDGPTHHGIFDIAFARSIPNIIIMAPSDEDQLADMLATALTIDGPTAIRYPRSCGLGISLKKEPEVLPVGKGVMLREGHDFLIIAIGSMVSPAVEASRLLATEGIAAGVLDARFVKPLDKELILQMASSAGRVLVVEEGILAGGFGSAILELFSEEGLENVRTSRMGIADCFSEHGTRDALLADFGLTSENIAENARSMLANRSGAILRRFSSIRH